MGRIKSFTWGYDIYSQTFGRDTIVNINVAPRIDFGAGIPFVGGGDVELGYSPEIRGVEIAPSAYLAGGALQGAAALGLDGAYFSVGLGVGTNTSTGLGTTFEAFSGPEVKVGLNWSTGEIILEGHFSAYVNEGLGVVSVTASATATGAGIPYVDFSDSALADPNSERVSATRHPDGTVTVITADVVTGVETETIFSQNVYGTYVPVTSMVIRNPNAIDAAMIAGWTYHDPGGPGGGGSSSDRHDRHGADSTLPNGTPEASDLSVPLPPDTTAPTGGEVWKDRNTGRTNVQGDANHTGHGTQAPLILDLDGDGVEVNASAQVNFDWDGDGFQESGNWAARNRSARQGLWRAAA